MAAGSTSPVAATGWRDASRGILGAAAAALVLADLYLILQWVPTDQTGVAQRIFYFHVPIVEAGFVGFAVALIASIGYLITRKASWDHAAYAAVEVSTIFLTIAIVLGSIWAKQAWGTWWTWEAKLTTTFVLWVTYVGYLMVRASAPTRGQAARWGAVIAVIAFVNVPIVYMASVWWERLHPPLLLTDTGGLEDAMRTAHRFSAVAFLVLLSYLTVLRAGQRRDEASVEALRRGGL